MSCDKYYRMIIKRASGLPTVPASADHRDGSWILTDIYEGELYQDTDTGIVYTRSNGTIISVDGPTAKTYEALLTQTGTGNPTVVVNENSLGTIVWTRVNVGQYRGTLVSAFTADKTHAFIQSGSEDFITFISRSKANIVDVYTTDKTLTKSDGILSSTPVRIKVYL
jgi:hypothetical protein